MSEHRIVIASALITLMGYREAERHEAASLGAADYEDELRKQWLELRNAADWFDSLPDEQVVRLPKSAEDIDMVFWHGSPLAKINLERGKVLGYNQCLAEIRRLNPGVKIVEV